MSLVPVIKCLFWFLVWASFTSSVDMAGRKRWGFASLNGLMFKMDFGVIERIQISYVTWPWVKISEPFALYTSMTNDYKLRTALKWTFGWIRERLSLFKFEQELSQNCRVLFQSVHVAPEHLCSVRISGQFTKKHLGVCKELSQVVHVFQHPLVHPSFHILSLQISSLSSNISSCLQCMCRSRILSRGGSHPGLWVGCGEPVPLFAVDKLLICLLLVSRMGIIFTFRVNCWLVTLYVAARYTARAHCWPQCRRQSCSTTPRRLWTCRSDTVQVRVFRPRAARSEQPLEFTLPLSFLSSSNVVTDKPSPLRHCTRAWQCLDGDVRSCSWALTEGEVQNITAQGTICWTSCTSAANVTMGMRTFKWPLWADPIVKFKPWDVTKLDISTVNCGKPRPLEPLVQKLLYPDYFTCMLSCKTANWNPWLWLPWKFSFLSEAQSVGTNSLVWIHMAQHPVPLRIFAVAEVVVQEFERLRVRGNVTRETLQGFVEDNFLPAGDELEPAELSDWSERWVRPELWCQSEKEMCHTCTHTQLEPAWLSGWLGMHVLGVRSLNGPVRLARCTSE